MDAAGIGGGSVRRVLSASSADGVRLVPGPTGTDPIICGTATADASGDVSGPSPASATGALFPGRLGLEGIAPIARAVWLGGTTAAALYLGAAYGRLWRIRRRARPAPPEWVAAGARLSERARLTRPPAILLSPEVPGPLAAGLWRAAILVFGYPENSLQPTLRKREKQTPAFQRLVEQLRARVDLTPRDSRKLAAEYMLFGLVDSVPPTDTRAEGWERSLRSTSAGRPFSSRSRTRPAASVDPQGVCGLASRVAGWNP